MESSQSFDPVEIVVRREMIEEAVKWVCRRLTYTIDRGAMNPRSLSEKLDDGIMGEIASVAVMQLLADKGRYVVAYDQIRKDAYKNADPGWDILTSRRPFDDWLLTTEDIIVKPAFAYSFSIKSSRIPEADHDDVHIAIAKRDFKIFRKSSSIEQDITADFELQIYYSLRQSEYDKMLVINYQDFTGHRIGHLIDSLEIVQRYGRCFVSGAASRETLIRHSHSLPEAKRYWYSFHEGYSKPMWCAPLRLGKSLKTLQ